MGANAGVAMRYLACEQFYKYVANSCHVHSECGEHCCEFDCQTDMVELSGSESEGPTLCCLN